MVFIILFIIFIMALTFLKKLSFDESMPVYISGVSCLVGILLYRFSSTVFDVFLVFELISLSLYAFTAKNFHDFLSLKLLSYLPVVFLNSLGVGYESFYLMFYLLCNISCFSLIELKYKKVIKAPVAAFLLFTVLVISEKMKFDLNIVLILIPFILLVISMFFKYKKYNVSHILLSTVVIESLLFLNHSPILKSLIIILYLVYLTSIILPKMTSNIAINNHVIFLLLISLIPLFKLNNAVLIIGFLIMTAKSYQTYKSDEVIYE